MLIWMLIKRSASLASEAAAATFQCKRSWCSSPKDDGDDGDDYYDDYYCYYYYYDMSRFPKQAV